MFRSSMLIILLGACNGGSDPVDTDPGNPAPAEAVVRGNLKAKPGRVYIADLAAGLGLASDACRELGSVPCLDVHGVGLGEVAPRYLRIYQPVEGLVTGNVATERVAALLCSKAASDGAFFPELPGPLDADDRSAIVSRLASGLLLRDPSPDEVDALDALYYELDADDRDTQWAIGACFAFATMTEARFL